MSTEPGPDVVTPLEPAAELLRALASPLRLALVRELAEGQRYVYELVAVTHASQSLVSQHLRVLRSARLVTRQRRGRETAYALTGNHVAQLVHDAVQHARELLPWLLPQPTT